MTEHMQLSDMPQFCTEVNKWLKARYGEAEGAEIWEAVSRQYDRYLEDIPDYGGKKASHALSIYGSILIFSMCPLLPDHPPVEELQELVTGLFMSGFVRLGKVLNLNWSLDMRLINKVFQAVGNKDRKQFAQHPAGFCNVSEPYDKENDAARYHSLPSALTPSLQKTRPDGGAHVVLQFRLLGHQPASRHPDPLRHLREFR